MERIRKLFLDYVQSDTAKEENLDHLYEDTNLFLLSTDVSEEIQEMILDFLHTELAPMCLEYHRVFEACHAPDLVEEREDSYHIRNEECLEKIIRIYESIIEAKMNTIREFFNLLEGSDTKKRYLS